MNYLLGLITLSPVTTIIPALYIATKIKEKKLKIDFNYWTIGLLLLFIWSFIVGVLNKDKLSILGSFLLLGYFFISIGAIELVKYDFLILRACKTLVAFTTIAAIIGIIEKVVFTFAGYPRHRIYSTFGNPNMTGSWFATSIFLIMYIVFTQRNNQTLKIYIPSATLILTALLLTGSRGSLIALAGAIIALVCLTNAKHNKKVLMGVLVVTVIVALITFGEGFLIHRYITAHPVQDSFSPRFKIWHGVIGMILEKPITGWGLLSTLSNGVELLPLYNMNTVHGHNLWLTLLSTTGTVGFSIYLYMKYRLFKDLYILYKIDKNLSLLFIALNAIVLIQGLVDVSLYAPQLGILFVSSGAITQKLVALKEYDKSKVFSLKKAFMSFNPVAIFNNILEK